MNYIDVSNIIIIINKDNLELYNELNVISSDVSKQNNISKNIIIFTKIQMKIY